MEFMYNEFDILNNEFDIPEPDPLANLDAFLMIGDAQNFLDEHYKEATMPRFRKIVATVVTLMSDAQAHIPLLRFFRA
jgi:hypothetical protein